MTDDGIIVPKSNFSRSPEARRSNHVREKRNSGEYCDETAGNSPNIAIDGISFSIKIRFSLVELMF